MSIVKSAILITLILLIVVPSIPAAAGPGLDPSWVLALNMAHAGKMVFGREIIFTYGPLGYLAYPTFPEAEPWAVFAFAWGIAIVTAYGLWRLSRHAGSWTAACLCIGIFWLCSVAQFSFPMGRMEAAVIALTLSIAARLSAKPWFDLGLLYFLGAVAMLTKLSLAVAPTVIALYFTGWLVWRSSSTAQRPWKPAALVWMVWPFAFVGLYWVSNGAPRGLLSYLRNSIDIVDGYSDAMAIAGPTWVVLAALLSCTVLFVFVPFLAGEIRRMAVGYIPLAVLSFMSFKSAMVREDGHCVGFQFELAAAALLFVALAPTLRSNIVVGLFAILCVGIGLIVQAQVWPQLLRVDLDRITGRGWLRDVNGFLHWAATVKALSVITERQLASIQIGPPVLPLVNGRRVTAFPHQIDLIRANHLRWRPLPVFQAYSAYTPALDRLDANELADASGPEAVLLSWGTIDRRHPFYETPQSWRALLNWYDLQLASPKLCVLRHRATPRFDPAVPAGNTVARWGENISLPPVADDQILLMEADARENFRGILERTLLRLAAVFVYPTLRSGRVGRGRVVRMNMTGGVVVSDWPESLKDVSPMFAGSEVPGRDRVVSIRLETRASSQFDPTIRIRWLVQRLHHAAD